ncbi:hypothetical protein EG327_001433 [Venturia inaequalis]|uniref:Uncharacterized protein n=1 Tax=Venturia inaequalis TaxID=5025 RepID=A0A8H3VJP0_VENIN|nr:hypothetical protein EG327_001433 [Venturia inaequalis]
MFTPASLQRIISASKNEFEVMAPRRRIREGVPTVKAIARLALASTWPKPKRARSHISSISVPPFGSSQTPTEKVKTKSKFRSPRNLIMDTFSKFSAHMPLQRYVYKQNTQNEWGASSPAMSIQRRDTDSTVPTAPEQNSAAEATISTPPTTRTPSPESDPKFIPKCLTVQGRHAKSYRVKVPANSVSSSISGRTDETPHCPRKLPFSRRQTAITKEPSTASNKEPPTPLQNLARFEREVTAYHKTHGRDNNQDAAQSLLRKYGIKIVLSSLQPSERVHLMSCLYRRAYDFEISRLPASSSCAAVTRVWKKKYPRFFPEWRTVDDFEWRFYDHEGEVRMEAYVAMAEETGEEGPFSRGEVERVWLEGFGDARGEMGEAWWGEVEGWVLRG